MLGIIELLILIIVFGALVAGIVGLIMLIRSGGKSGDAKVCGKCNYSVTGLSTFDCPECGSDLREVGIINQGGGNRGLAIVLVLVGALALFCTCGGVGFLFLQSPQPVGMPAVPTPTLNTSTSESDESYDDIPTVETEEE